MWSEREKREPMKYRVSGVNWCMGYNKIWEVFLAVSREGKYLEEYGRTFGLVELAEELEKSKVVYILNENKEVIFIVERRMI